jgi:hypothetical protein
VILGHHALLVTAVVALALAGWGIAGHEASTGPERILAAAVYAGALAALEALALGLVGLGASPAALTAAALLSWVVARSPGAVAHVGPGAAAGLGLVAATGLWQLRHPAVGVDGVTYHLPEVAQWVASGHVGAVPTSGAEFPTGAYPLLNEVILAWGTAIGHSFIFQSLWAPATFALLALAGWTGLRELRVPALPAALAVGALLLEPDVLRALNTPKNDLPALAWLAAGYALAARGRRGPAILAAGMAVGTKTTTAPLAALLLVLAVRPPLRALRVPAAAAALLGGLWYARNTVRHGWPLWPVSSGPFGDPLPNAIQRLHVSLLQRPGQTLAADHLRLYVELVSGGLVLMGGGALAWLARRDRATLVASGATAISILVWAAAPFTGRAANPVIDLSLSTTRYLMPAVACGATALALAARGRGTGARAATAVLAAAFAWDAWRATTLGFPVLPDVGTLVLGVLGGVLVAAAIRRTPRLALGALAPAAVLLLGLSAPGWLARTAHVSATSAAPLEAWFSVQPGFHDAREPIAFSPVIVGPLAGDRVTHDLRFIGPREPCAKVLARLSEGWVVVRVAPLLDRFLEPRTTPGCLAGVAPVHVAGDYRVYRQTATRSSASSTSSAPRRKSSGSMAAAAGS